MIQKIVVLGSGSAGLIAALTLKRKLPTVGVRIVRDPAIGVIGVGEGTTPNFVRHLFSYLGIKPDRFYALAKPTWKLGIRFKWGPRGSFNYTFDSDLDGESKEIPIGFHYLENAENASYAAALMNASKAFPRRKDGLPQIESVGDGFAFNAYAFHVENVNLVEALEAECKEAGVKITDGKMVRADQGESGIEAIHLEDGQRIEADFFIDSSGFRGELISGVLEEPFVSFDKTLFCDRAVVGGWEREKEPIHPYTTAEQMDSGWAWQIEHEHHINRGYVFSSDLISDEDAFAEFKKKNPKIPDEPRFVPFNTGHRKRSWVKNVVAIGNSAGFVEPLEATALMVICFQCMGLAKMFKQSHLAPSESMRRLYNEIQQTQWDMIRDFLGLHYKLNTAMDTPFWKRCREETDLSGIQDALDFYEENGPSPYFSRLIQDDNDFGADGFLIMLINQNAPCKTQFKLSKADRKLWDEHRLQYARLAAKGLTVKESLKITRDPRWRWQAPPR